MSTGKTKEHRNKFFKQAFRIILLLIVLGFTLFTYQQLTLNYQVIEKSYQINEALIREQAGLLKYRKEELNFVKNKLLQTDLVLRDLQQENEKLRENLKVIDRIVLLEQKITLLEDKNQSLLDQVDMLNRGPDFTAQISSPQEGEKVLGQYRGYVRQIKRQLKVVKDKARQDQIAYQKEQDRVKLLVGNNGYVIKNGQISPMEISFTPAVPGVKVDVQFVK